MSLGGGIDRVDRRKGVFGRLQAFLADAPRIIVGKTFVGGHALAHAFAQLTFGENGRALGLSEGGMCAYYQSGPTNRSYKAFHCESPNIGGSLGAVPSSCKGVESPSNVRLAPTA